MITTNTTTTSSSLLSSVAAAKKQHGRGRREIDADELADGDGDDKDTDKDEDKDTDKDKDTDTDTDDEMDSRCLTRNPQDPLMEKEEENEEDDEEEEEDEEKEEEDAFGEDWLPTKKKKKEEKKTAERRNKHENDTGMTAVGKDRSGNNETKGTKKEDNGNERAEDVRVVLSALLRWMVLVSLLVLLSAGCHDRLALVDMQRGRSGSGLGPVTTTTTMSSSTSMSFSAATSLPLLSKIDRRGDDYNHDDEDNDDVVRRTHYEACYGDVGIGSQKETSAAAVIETGDGDDIKGGTCPAPSADGLWDLKKSANSHVDPGLGLPSPPPPSLSSSSTLTLFPWLVNSCDSCHDQGCSSPSSNSNSNSSSSCYHHHHHHHHHHLLRPILLLGFPTSHSLRRHVFESYLSSLSWSIAFVLIRKGLHPNEIAEWYRFGQWTRRHCATVPLFKYEYWRSAAFGGLGVFYSSFVRGIVRNWIQRDAFVDWWCSNVSFVVDMVVTMTSASSLMMTTTTTMTIKKVGGYLYDAFMIGSCWAVSQFAIRRRLDPRTRTDMFRKGWKDVFVGSIALGCASLGRALLKDLSCPSLSFVHAFAFAFASTSYYSHICMILNESIRSGLCWGCTFLFIRRGLNPETNSSGFVSRYGLDATLGALAIASIGLIKPCLRNVLIAMHNRLMSAVALLDNYSYDDNEEYTDINVDYNDNDANKSRRLSLSLWLSLRYFVLFLLGNGGKSELIPADTDGNESRTIDDDATDAAAAAAAADDIGYDYHRYHQQGGAWSMCHADPYYAPAGGFGLLASME